MDKELVANYLKSLKEKTGLTFPDIASKCKRSESSVKKLFGANVDDPRVDTIMPIVYALGGSMDEMLNPGKSRDELKEVSVAQLREMYEMQIATMKETSEAHIENIRKHYEQHREEIAAQQREKREKEKIRDESAKSVCPTYLYLLQMRHDHRADAVRSPHPPICV
jgi:transcriptional regulator with XRE-family HTH domain